MSINMLCPACKHLLVVSGQAHLETLNEHVSSQEPSLKNTYQCPNKECDCCKFEVAWNEDGEYYNTFGYKKPQVWDDFYANVRRIKFINDNNGPFNTISRQINVEVYKKGLPKEFAIIKRNKFLGKLYFEINYIADINGNVLKKSHKLQYITPSGFLYISGLHMFLFSMKQLKTLIKSYLYMKQQKTLTCQLIKHTVSALESTFDKRWWKRLSTWLFRVYYRNLYFEMLSDLSMLEWKGKLNLKEVK